MHKLIEIPISAQTDIQINHEMDIQIFFPDIVISQKLFITDILRFQNVLDHEQNYYRKCAALYRSVKNKRG